jgi:hypothetical protein
MRAYRRERAALRLLCNEFPVGKRLFYKPRTNQKRYTKEFFSKDKRVEFVMLWKSIHDECKGKIDPN